tara:strand:+ start:864 stop:1286 length:423 start_codon:yes stop_codon:yes gene_type:complete
MAATVYNGVIQGTGGSTTQTLYTNNTGGNVRLIFNYLELGNGTGGVWRIYIGTTSSPDHPNGNDLDTIELNPPSSSVFGKGIGYAYNNDVGNHHAYAQTGAFLTEIMLPANNSIYVRIPSQVSSNVKAVVYNFTAIPEGN